MQIHFNHGLDIFFDRIDRWSRRLFDPGTQETNPWPTRIWMGCLFLVGVYLWGYFLRWGSIPFSLHDWYEITGPRLAFLQDALKQGVLPLHISDPLTLGGVSDCFLSIPDQILSPQILLLLFMSIGKFVLVDVLLLYTVGFLGLLWFRRKYSLSWFSFTLLFGLFNFNGQILGHLSIGHLTWGGYFLFPWFAALVISFIEGDHSWKWIAKMSLLLLAILLQGAYHQYVWTLIFLFFLAFANRRYILPIAGTLGLSILVNAFRILPPFLLLGSFNNAYVGGYLTFTDIWKAMIERMQPGSVIITSLNAQPVKAWEVTLFVGLAGAIFMVIFGLYRWLRGREGKILYWELILPLTGLFLFSFDRIYRYVRYLPLPILSGERVADRFLTLPFFFIMILAAIELQRWLNQPHRNQVILRIGAIGLFLAGSQDLWLNLKSWTPRSVSNHMPSFAFKLENWFVVNHADPSYTTILIVGALISLISISFVLFMALRKQKNIPPTGAS